eukprot:SM000283S10686  [mRNA]  locus=s283:36380:39952:+ [translate_table: standard]
MLIAAYGWEGKTEHAEGIFQDMKAAGVRRGRVAYTQLLVTYTKAGRMEAAEGVLADMAADGVTPSLSAYNALIEGYALKGDYSNAESALAGLRASGLSPNGVTYTALVRGYARGGQPAWAADALAEMRATGLEPTADTHGAMVEAYAKAGAVRDAEGEFALLRQKATRGRLATTFNYNCLISAYARIGAWEKSLARFGELLRDGLLPNEITLLGVVDACGKANRCDEAARFWREHVAGRQPGARLFLALIDGYGRAGHVREAREAFQEFLSLGSEVQANTPVFTAMINAYGTAGMLPEMFATVEEMRVAGADVTGVTLNVLLMGLGRAGLADQAAELAVRMEADGYELGGGAYTALVEAYAVAGRPAAAVAAHTAMAAQGLETYPRIAAALVEAHARAGDAAAAAAAFRQLASGGIRPSAGMYSALVTALAACPPDDATTRAAVEAAMEQARSPLHAVTLHILGAEDGGGTWEADFHAAMQRLRDGAEGWGVLEGLRSYMLALAASLWAAPGRRGDAAVVAAVAKASGLFARLWRREDVEDREGRHAVLNLAALLPGAAGALATVWLRDDARNCSDRGCASSEGGGGSDIEILTAHRRLTGLNFDAKPWLDTARTTSEEEEGNAAAAQSEVGRAVAEALLDLGLAASGPRWRPGGTEAVTVAVADLAAWGLAQQQSSKEDASPGITISDGPWQSPSPAMLMDDDKAGAKPKIRRAPNPQRYVVVRRKLQPSSEARRSSGRSEGAGGDKRALEKKQPAITVAAAAPP